LADLCLDAPMIHKYVVNFLISPMIEKEKLDLTKVTWVSPPKPKNEEEEDDEYVFGNDSFFKMLAFTLADLEKQGYPIAKYTPNWEAGMKLMA